MVVVDICRCLNSCWTIVGKGAASALGEFAYKHSENIQSEYIQCIAMAGLIWGTS